MAWTNPDTVTAGQVLAATRWNTHLVANLDFLAKPPSVRVTKSTDQSVANAVWRSLSWGAEAWDTDTMWSSTAATRVDINTAGKYLVTASLGWASSTAGSLRAIGLYAGAVGSSTSSPNQDIHEIDAPSTAASQDVQPGCRISTILSLTSTSVVRVQAYQNTGGALSVLHSTSGAHIPQCSIIWMSS